MAEEQVAKRIRQARRERELTMEEAARQVGVSRQTWAAWEKPGGHDPQPIYLSSLAELLNRSVSWLLYGTETSTGDAALPASKPRFRTAERRYIEILEMAVRELVTLRESNAGLSDTQAQQAALSLATLIALSDELTDPKRSEYSVASRLVEFALVCNLNLDLIRAAGDSLPRRKLALNPEEFLELRSAKGLRSVQAIAFEGEADVVTWFGIDQKVIAKILVRG